MNKGTAIVGFLLSFIAGMFLMWGADRRSGADIHAESGNTTTSAGDQSAASVPVTANDPQWPLNTPNYPDGIAMGNFTINPVDSDQVIISSNAGVEAGTQRTNVSIFRQSGRKS